MWLARNFVIQNNLYNSSVQDKTLLNSKYSEFCHVFTSMHLILSINVNHVVGLLQYSDYAELFIKVMHFNKLRKTLIFDHL